MQFWNTILHTALLGTDKERFDAGAGGPELAEMAGMIGSPAVDKEDQFLQIAALAFNYRQAGSEALRQEGAGLSVSPAEELPYCRSAAIQVLSDLFEEGNISLIRLWLSLCAGRGRVVFPEWLPRLFQLGVAEKTLREDINRCGGRRGIWLAGLNPEWDYSEKGSAEERWQTGSPEQRRQVLYHLRGADPARAREWLQQTWAGEDANTKVDLLKQMAVNAGAEDLVFLESLQGEKSKKVKDEVLALLKKIPGSAPVRSAGDLLLKLLVLDPALGVLAASEEDSAVLKGLGVEVLSNRKELSDDEYIVYQLIKMAPLERLETAWGMNSEGLTKVFDASDTGKKLLPAAVLSVLHFGDRERALALTNHSSSFYLDLLPLLPFAVQEAQSLRFFSEHAAAIVQYATMRPDEWGVGFALALLKLGVTQPYQYNKVFFAKHIRLLPVAVLEEVRKIQGEGVYASYWDSTRDAVIRLLELKQRTINAFNE